MFLCEILENHMIRCYFISIVKWNILLEFRCAANCFVEWFNSAICCWRKDSMVIGRMINSCSLKGSIKKVRKLIGRWKKIILCIWVKRKSRPQMKSFLFLFNWLLLKFFFFDANKLFWEFFMGPILRDIFESIHSNQTFRNAISFYTIICK